MQQSIPEIIRTIPLGHYLILSAALFVIGMMGVLFRRNIIIVFMSIEIMLNAVNLMFAAVSAYHSDPSGQIMVFFVMTIAAAEASVGLAIAVAVFKRFHEVNIAKFENLKG